jgi:hypothetical protein
MERVFRVALAVEKGVLAQIKPSKFGAEKTRDTPEEPRLGAAI